jgi:putative transposase
LTESNEVLRKFVEPENENISISRQCSLINLSRSTFYYVPVGTDKFTLKLMKLIDRIYTECPFFGSPKITEEIKRKGIQVNHKRIERLMRVMGIEALIPKKNLSKAGGKDSIIYPYLLTGVEISKINQVWSTDITYIPMRNGYMYLVAVIDWFSRYVLSWQLSNTLDVMFCLDALEEALSIATPEIFNTDQGSQFTSKAFTDKILGRNIELSMDSKGRALDNIFIERLWRSLKYEDIYIKEYETARELFTGLKNYFKFYNNKRIHQSLGYRTPAELYC